MANPLTDFLTSLEDTLEAYRVAHSDFLLGVMDAMRQLAEDLDQIPGPDPEPEPEPEPEPPAEGSVFGWNVGDAMYWAAGRPLNNKAALCGIQYGRLDQTPQAVFDRFGNLVSGKANVPIWLSSAMCPPGRYDVLHAGIGSVSPTMLIVQDSSQLQQLNLDLSGEVVGLSVSLAGTVGVGVTTEFAARHRGAASIRLMDLRRINFGDARGMNHYRINRDGPTPILEQTVTPYEAITMVESSGAQSLWWNWHHLDTDEFVSECCEEFAQSRQYFPIYMELSNEVWGPFPAGAWADGQAGGRYAWQNRRTKEILAIARQILGTRVIGVLGSQCTNLGVTQQVLRGGTDGIDCLAVAPYFNWFTSPPATFAEAITKIRQHLDQVIYPALLAQLELARDAGLRLVAYEAGVDLSWHNNAAAEPLYRRLIESDEVAGIYREFCEWWLENINDVCCFFNDVNHHGYGHWYGERLAPQPRGAVVQEMIRNA
jgi:hypothetical protein